MVVQFFCPESGVTKFFEARPDIQQDHTLPFIKLRCKYVSYDDSSDTVNGRVVGCCGHGDE